jgi:hypothetical protein
VVREVVRQQHLAVQAQPVAFLLRRGQQLLPALRRVDDEFISSAPTSRRTGVAAAGDIPGRSSTSFSMRNVANTTPSR